MYSLISIISWSELLKRQIPILLTAFVLAELFYKFHSFTLECVAFLATWFILDAGTNLLWARQDKPGRPELD